MSPIAARETEAPGEKLICQSDRVTGLGLDLSHLTPNPLSPPSAPSAPQLLQPGAQRAAEDLGGEEPKSGYVSWN